MDEVDLLLTFQQSSSSQSITYNALPKASKSLLHDTTSLTRISSSLSSSSSSSSSSNNTTTNNNNNHNNNRHCLAQYITHTTHAPYLNSVDLPDAVHALFNQAAADAISKKKDLNKDLTASSSPVGFPDATSTSTSASMSGTGSLSDQDSNNNNNPPTQPNYPSPPPTHAHLFPVQLNPNSPKGRGVARLLSSLGSEPRTAPPTFPGFATGMGRYRSGSVGGDLWGKDEDEVRRRRRVRVP